MICLILDEKNRYNFWSPTKEREFTFDITLRDKFKHPHVKIDVKTFTMNLKNKVDVKYIESEFNTPNCYIEEEKDRYNHDNSNNYSLLLRDIPFSV